MKLLSISLAVLVAAAPSLVQAKIERIVEKSFPVTANGQLFVRTQGGDIHVKTDPQVSEVKVRARQVINASSDAEADALLEKMTLEIEQSGSEIKAQSRVTDSSSSSWSWKKRPGVVVYFDVVVPPTYATDLATSGGDVELGDSQAKAKIATSGGDIRVGHIQATVDASTSGGDVSVAGHTASAKLSSSGGDIRVGDSGAALSATTSGGDITVQSARAAVKATTSGGDVKVGFEDAVSAEVSLASSGGDIVVTVGKAAAFHLNASTSGGDVQARGLTLQIEQGAPGKSKLVAAVNGGGPDMKLRTSGGDVRVSLR